MEYYASAENYYKKNEPYSYVRFLHAAPNTSNLSLNINDTEFIKNISYRSFTEYNKALPGMYEIKIYKDTNKTNPLYKTKINIDPKTIYTVALCGKNNYLSVDIIPDTPKISTENKASMRYINLLEDKPDLDIAINDKMQISHIKYQNVSKYLDYPPDTYTLNAYDSSSKEKILSVPNIKLKPGKYYAAYIIGTAERESSIQVLLPLEGTTYLKF